jgi:hypothetical protein
MSGEPPDGIGLPGLDAVFCRSCRRALNVRVVDGRVSFLHAQELRGGTCDHRADPAPLAELSGAVLECDFCSRPEAVWAYVCADRYTQTRIVTARVLGAGDYRDRHRAARVRRTETKPGMTQAWGVRWASCDGCATLIENRDLYGLITRVTEAMPAKLTRGNRLVRVRGELHSLYSDVFATLAAGRTEITPGPPPDETPPPAAVP